MNELAEMAVDIITKGKQVMPVYMSEAGWPQDKQPKIESVCSVTLDTPPNGDTRLHVVLGYQGVAGGTEYGSFQFKMEAGKVVGDF